MKQFCLIIFFISTLLVPAAGKAADTLRLADAVVLALENNFSISLAENNLKIAETGNSLGNAGMLPVLGLTGSRSLAINNSKQIYYDGRTREGKDAKTNNQSAGLQLNWTFFDGFNMFIQKDKLNELEKLSALQLRSVIEGTVAAVVEVYYNIAAQQALANVYREALRNSAERRLFAKARADVGSGSELAVLQATVDMNADSANYLRQLAVVENLKSDLNLLLCRNLIEPFEVDTAIPLKYDLRQEELWVRAQQENPDLQRARNAVGVATLTVKELRSQQLPRLSLNSGYNFSKSKSDVGLMTSNRNYGFTVGVSLAYNIFDGFTTRQQIAQARIREESAQTEAEQLQLQLQANLQQTYNDYVTNLRLVKFETESLDLARQNFAVAEEKYRLGSLTDVELRETQVKLMEAENRLLTSKFRCKTAETELCRIAGLLSVENGMQ